MRSSFEILIKETLLSLLVLMENLMFKELHKGNVCSLLQVFFNCVLSLFHAFLVSVEILVAEFAFDLVFF